MIRERLGVPNESPPPVPTSGRGGAVLVVEHVPQDQLANTRAFQPARRQEGRVDAPVQERQVGPPLERHRDQDAVLGQATAHAVIVAPADPARTAIRGRGGR